MESKTFSKNLFESKTLNYNYEIQVSYLQLSNTTSLISSIQNLRLKLGTINWQSPTNYDVFVVRLKNWTDCLRKENRNRNAIVRISITSTKLLPYQQFNLFRREVVTRRNVDMELSCRNPVKFVSVAGRFQIPNYEYISESNTKMEVFWTSAIQNVKTCPFCCA